MNRKEFTDTKNVKLDTAAFESLFYELYPLLCRYSLQFVRNAEIAEEIVQEQFIHFWEKHDDIQIHTSYSAYLYRSVRNRSIDYLKSTYAKIQFVDEEMSYPVEDASNPLQIIIEKESEFLINRAIESLPEKCFLIFSLSRYGELSHKEISEKLSISEKTVENQITIAIKKIKSFMQKYTLTL
jgi:RNA polymerase sigma-70 factor, ECF subfamily